MLEGNQQININDLQTGRPLSLSVFFPCYNEQDNVKNTVEKAILVLDELKADYEIIIVNDGSSDETGKIADQISNQHDRVKAVHHPRNLGYGGALQSGIKASTKELIFYTDGDGQFDIREMPQLIALIKDYDFITCYRLDRKDNFARKLNAWCWTKLVCLLFRMKIRDIDCAFKLFKKEIFDNIQMYSTGALIDTEILARAIGRGYTYTQIGVHHYPRTAGAQTGANIKVIFRAFKELFKLHKQICSDMKKVIKDN